MLYFKNNQKTIEPDPETSRGDHDFNEDDRTQHFRHRYRWSDRKGTVWVRGFSDDEDHKEAYEDDDNVLLGAHFGQVVSLVS